MLLHVDKLREGEGEESYKVVEAAGIPRWDANAKLAVVGQPHPRVEGREKVTGRARYAYDVREPGQLYARVLRSPHPHARLRRVDSSRAEALAGVRAIIHAFNVPEIDELCERIAPHMIQGFGARGPNPEGKSIRTFGAQMVEVEVDVETGQVTVLRVVAAHDCGRVVNATMVESQIVGGVTQGLGFALSEERVVLAGVAPIPWRARAAEDLLRGASPSEEVLGRAAEAALEGAQPLGHNGYKVPLARALVRRALARVCQA
jgi:CO/xanthine dehydrogenase Mo-binding subunit